MTNNAQVLIAGISYYIEETALEISRRVIRHYSHDDSAAAKEAIDHLVREGVAYVVKSIDEAKEEEICLVMLGYPGGNLPYLGWRRWFNKTLARSALVPPEVVQASLLPLEEPNQSPQTDSGAAPLRV